MLRHKSKRLIVFAGILSCAAAIAQPLPTAKRPEDAGFSSQRLETARKVIKDDVEKKALPGAVLLIVHNGKVVDFDAIGFQERANQTAMKKDSIFRVASMSKPITTVSAMILAEEGKLDIGANVSQYLPRISRRQSGS